MEIKFVTIDTCYEDYLGLCGMDVVRLVPQSPPAVLYNQILDQSDGLVCFVHSDVTCRGLKESIIETIDLFGFDGAMGVVGAGSRWGSLGIDLVSQTCDSCCIVVDASRPERFDSKTFDGFHLYVEDYCMQVGGARIIRINGYEGWGEKFIDGNRWFIHHSQTLHKLGCAWGDYLKYKTILFKKWGKTVHTT